jgi:hypothetical protein
MFEREIKFIYDFNLNKVNKLGPFFTFEQLLSTNLHPALLQYISAEIDYLIFEDRQKLLKNSVFDYSGEKISYHFNQISEEVKRTKRFSLEYIAKLVLHASSFTVNYLVHPKWTLKKFVFDEDTTKTTNEIKQILNYVYYYKYLNKILISYINTKKILSMNVQEFEELLNKADKLGVETYLPAILSNALKSMAEFLNIGEIKKDKIPLSAVEIFLEEKELTNHLQKVNDVFGQNENAKFPINDFEKALKNIPFIKEEIFAETLEQEPAQDEIVLEPQEEEEIGQEPDQEFTRYPLQPVEGEASILGGHGQEFVEEDKLAEAGSEDESTVLNETKSEFQDESEIVNEQIEREPFEEFETSFTDLSDNDKEITVPQSTKIRIKINDDMKVETIEQPNSEPEADKIDRDLVNDKLELSDIDEEEEQYSEEQFIEEETGLPNEQGNDDEEHLSFVFKQQETINLEPIQEESVDDLHAAKEEFDDEIKEEKNSDIKIESKNGDRAPLDLAEILEHKEMTKIIELIYDYDIEDFANTLDEISKCHNVEQAFLIINQTLISRRINRNSKEAEIFREIIAQYFSHR